MRLLPIFILFLLQMVLILAVVLIIYITNFIFNKNFSSEGTLILLSMYPAFIYSFKGLMNKFLIKSSDAILLTKIMAWSQVIPVLIVIIIGFVEGKLTVSETLILIFLGLLLVFFLRYLGVTAIYKIDLKNNN